MQNKFIKRTTSKDPLDQCQIFEDIKFTGADSIYKGIIVSSVCDIVTPEKGIDYYNFCPILPFKILFFSILKEKHHIAEEDFSTAMVGKDKRDTFYERIKRLMNNQIDRQHWLGDILGNDELWYIDYQLVQSVPFSEKENLMKKRIAKVESPYKESIYVRFSNYMGRVGLPGTSEEKLKEAEVIFEMYKGTKKMIVH